ncbi:LOW QUALITY PROTEIN: cadherin-23-like [Galleria mellonella]|uniref:LOW QUALITY PROTEIN: cadherin-23-like n=1 Tax=Galleria mellonella TaxID=7137 RepID=A0ABM3N7L5_GALME|nr:LOW QUALITY PROTEIN: cadherin-23-like [Galleria mellonella]
MEVHIRLAAITLFLLSIGNVQSENDQSDYRCSFMTAIPRPERPYLPDQDFTGIPWSERQILPAQPERKDVCVEHFPTPITLSRTQIIYMDEEIEGDVVIARLNYYGDTAPVIQVPFDLGSSIMLGAKIEKDGNGDWELVITQRQDYESPGMQNYIFQINAPGETDNVRILLSIVNIDDNDPIIRLFDTCQVEELGEPGRLTNCTYEVWDADGLISTSAMTFRIDSNRDDDQIFYIDAHIQENLFYMNMTIGLNRSLNFVDNALHIFTITAMDSYPNNHTVTIMVQVINVEHRVPRWIEIFAVQQFDEKTYQEFTVQAVDGDTGIDKPICYKLKTEPNDTFFSIETIEGGRSGAIFHVSPIDRDALEREIFQLSIIAYKCDNETLATEDPVVIIVNDINDQRPVPLQKEYYIDILEETALTLAFDEPIGFHDRDLGENAQYRVHLEDVNPPHAASAFYVAPEVGYQRQTFIMGTVNHSMLDYEVEEFQHITLHVIATDLNNPDFKGIATVFINLINWNDELPIFNDTIQEVSFNETEGQGFYVATVRAYDRDIDDKVVHSLMGNAVDFLEIHPETGEIYVLANDSFNYHRQNELFVQIRADDTLGEPYNTATSQLVIQLIDINNTPPTLRLPRGSPHVEENVPEGYEISSEIHASDPDTTAELVFEIDWESSYATKQGRETDPAEYHGCVYIETLYPNEDNHGDAIGRVVVREIRHNVTIDYEEFEVLYLTVRVTDLNTIHGDPYDESTFTITIIDMNDNEPLWVDGTLEQVFRVTEMAPSGTVIGSVLATDIDGPLYNQVRYTIRARDNTPEDLVKINFYTGQLQVDANEAIDADTPPRYELYYTVTASDGCYAENRTECPPDDTEWNTDGDITIQITDTNNKWPQPEISKFNTTVWIYENATHGDEVVQIVSSDLDRDELYHTVSYQINYQVNPRLRDFFSVDLETGLVYVDYTTDEVLDRDGDEPRHTIFLTLTDNFLSGGDGRRNQNETEVLVILLDVNDNAPELPHGLFWSVSESLLEGELLEGVITAPDRDEPDTDNSRVGYTIHNLTVTDRPGLEHPDLFGMLQLFNVSGQLYTAVDLKGYWGTYAIHIGAFDHGVPQLFDDEIYEIEIRPYNYRAPEFVFPADGTTVRLARERATTNGLLALVNGEFLDQVSATDEDGLHAGLVTFDISGDAEASQFFEVSNNGENLGTLMLRELFPEDIREFTVTIRATDGGTEPGPLSSTSTLNIIFVPTQGDPVFNTNTANIAFFEKEQGLIESFQLPLAEDPKNYKCDNDCHNIYYTIADGYDEGYFSVDPLQNIIYLKRELDRNETATHTLVVVASNSMSPGPSLASSMLTVTVTVREANPRPNFVSDHYSAGISTLDTINKELLTVEATHSEADAVIMYAINYTSMVVDPSLEAVKETAFALDPNSGVLTLTMQPTVSMHGMFEFNVIANDTDGAQDTAAVNIYLISSLNRVFFIFWNTFETVEKNRRFIAQTFSAGFSMTCNIDQVVPASDSSGVMLEDVTEVRAHFIRDNEPVLADEIEELRSDTLLLRSIQMTLNTELLVLQDFVTENSPNPGIDSSLTIIYVLAALAGLLAFMCLLLLLTFVIRTKALNRQLQALSMTKYGSVDSGLNRAGIAPGTNKHAAEGSNPIWNESIKAPDFDTLSDTSDTSDLVGVEDMMEFNYDSTPTKESADPSRDTVATHSNNFGFNASPFSTEFTHNFGR